MSTSPNSLFKSRSRLLAAAASVAIAGAVGLGAVTTGTVPVFAEAVRVDGPQAPGFADVVQRVSPAVVSVRVKAKSRARRRRWRADVLDASRTSKIFPTTIR